MIGFGLGSLGEELMDDRDIFIHTAQGQFEYDADFDIYRRRQLPCQLTVFERYGWIAVCLVLTALCYYVTL